MWILFWNMYALITFKTRRILFIWFKPEILFRPSIRLPLRALLVPRPLRQDLRLPPHAKATGQPPTGEGWGEGAPSITSRTKWTLNIQIRVICLYNSYNKFIVQLVWPVFFISSGSTFWFERFLPTHSGLPLHTKAKGQRWGGYRKIFTL